MQRSTQKILVINCGSSSIKLAVFEAATPPKKELSGEITHIGQLNTLFTYHDLITEKTGSLPIGTTPAVHFLMDWLKEYVDMNSISGIGHRVVHGMRHHEPERVLPELLAELSRISAYDPEHLPQEIEMMEVMSERYPKILQVACFDTSFHAAMPRVARILPLPRRLEAMGIQRYGFHGLSYAWLMEELTRVAGKNTAKGKIILAHLGSGASLAAVKDGQSIDTSMGFTPSSGLVMGTRTGDLDPGVACFLMQSEKLTPAQFNDLINHQSGLLGISETSADVQQLLESQLKDKRAAEAIELFCYQAKKWIGSFAAVLEGLNTLVFSGGIGANAPEVRLRICAGLQFLGIELDEKRNFENAPVISTASSRVTVRVIATNEELMIAQAVADMNMTPKK